MMERKLQKININSLDHLALQLQYPKGKLIIVSRNTSKYYHSFPKIVKGQRRHFDEPLSELRKILNNLKNILDRIELPECLQGGRKGCSIVTNAQIHIGKAAVLNFDIQKFFPSIHYPRVYKTYLKLDCSPDVASLLTRLTTYGGCIPHGSPTSTVVANLCIVPLAKRIARLAETHKSGFSQFVDDGVISGPAYIERLRKLIDRIIRQEGFTASPKPHKRQTRYWYQEQIVTGVKVNYGIDVPSGKYNEIYSEIQGMKSLSRTGNTLSGKKLAALTGKINHIKMLKHSKGENLQHLFKKIA